MKTITSLFILTLIFTIQLYAQDFDEALELYEQEQFGQAVLLFETIGDDESNLYAGKSHLALGNYTRANSFLELAGESSNVSIRDEAKYSLAISYFQQENFDRSLSYLYDLIESNNRTGLRIDSSRLYRQIMNYLSIDQRFRTLQKVSHPQIRYDLVESSKTYTDADTYQILVSELVESEPDSSLQQQFIENLTPDSQLHQFFNRYPTPPNGLVYNIGIILPTFDEDDPDFIIPRNLYYGMILAADDFNSRNSDQKVRLHFKNSAENPDTTAAALTELVWQKNIDAVVGPLFSEPAERMAQLAEEYQLPMMAPLANSDELNLDYNYTFQLNPTFEVHGRNMARFAVEELELDTLAVITERDALGRSAALGFRYEAERLGAHISYYIEDDFASMGYDMSEYTDVFTPDQEIINSSNYTRSQAIYAPFTGQASSTMANLLLNDLEAMRSEVIILGSEEWATTNIREYQRRFFEIYYSEAMGEAADTSAVEYFEEDFENRFGSSPDFFSKTGYDAVNYLLQSIETAGNPVYLNRTLRDGVSHNGLSMRINFEGNRVNQHVFIRPLTPKAEERMGDNENPEN